MRQLGQVEVVLGELREPLEPAYGVVADEADHARRSAAAGRAAAGVCSSASVSRSASSGSPSRGTPIGGVPVQTATPSRSVSVAAERTPMKE